MSNCINIKRLKDTAKLPTKETEHSAGYDIYSCLSSQVTIGAHRTIRIPTGLSIEIPHGYFVAIFSRSELAINDGIRVANCVGVIAEDYRGEWIIPLHNDSDIPVIIKDGERLAKIVFIPYLNIDFVDVNDLDVTDRGSGGFGSTGE